MVRHYIAYNADAVSQIQQRAVFYFMQPSHTFLKPEQGVVAPSRNDAVHSSNRALRYCIDKYPSRTLFAEHNVLKSRKRPPQTCVPLRNCTDANVNYH